MTGNLSAVSGPLHWTSCLETGDFRSISGTLHHARGSWTSAWRLLNTNNLCSNPIYLWHLHVKHWHFYPEFSLPLAGLLTNEHYSLRPCLSPTSDNRSKSILEVGDAVIGCCIDQSPASHQVSTLPEGWAWQGGSLPPRLPSTAHLSMLQPTRLLLGSLFGPLPDLSSLAWHSTWFTLQHSPHLSILAWHFTWLLWMLLLALLRAFDASALDP